MATRLDIDTKFCDAHADIVVRGEIDMGTTSYFRNMLIETALHAHDIIVDMSRVPFCDSAGIGVMVATWKQMRGDGGALLLVGCYPQLRKMVHVMGLDQFLPCYDSRDDALAALAERDRAADVAQTPAPSRWTVRPAMDSPRPPA